MMILFGEPGSCFERKRTMLIYKSNYYFWASFCRIWQHVIISHNFTTNNKL